MTVVQDYVARIVKLESALKLGSDNDQKQIVSLTHDIRILSIGVESLKEIIADRDNSLYELTCTSDNQLREIRELKIEIEATVGIYERPMNLYDSYADHIEQNTASPMAVSDVMLFISNYLETRIKLETNK